MFRALKFAFTSAAPSIWLLQMLALQTKQPNRNQNRQKELNEPQLCIPGRKKRYNENNEVDEHVYIERPRIAHKTNSNTKYTSDTTNGSKGDVLTTTSVTKIDTVTNKNSKNSPLKELRHRVGN